MDLQSHRDAKKLTGPSWPVLLGHYLRWLPDKLGFLQQCVQAHGDVVNLSLAAPFARTYLLNDPADIGHVLQSNHLNYAKTKKLTGPGGRKRSGEGLLTSVGSAAITQKRLLQPALAQLVMPRLEQIVLECTQTLLASWPQEIDAVAEMTTLARRILGRALLSEEFDPSLTDAIAVSQRHIRRVYESVLPVRPTRVEQAATRCIDEHLHRHIAAHRHQPREDLLGLFIAARYSDGSAMTDKQVRDEALTMLSTGYETVALGLAWALFLLAQNPDQQTANAEFVFSEALRLYPPTWIYVRVAQADDVLPSGARVRAGTKLYLCPYVTHRDARFFPEPEQFRPERFAGPLPRFAYFPFSAGPRVCLGQGFAMLEGTLVLNTITKRFRWDLVPGQTIVPAPGQFLFPNGPIRIRLRQ